MTTNFVSKISKIKNNKEKEYYVHRINIPSYVTKELDLKPDDHIFIKAKKAEWYHMLEWDTMSKTWEKLPENIKRNIIDDGLIEESRAMENLFEEHDKQEIEPITSSTSSPFRYNIGSG